MCLLQLRSPPDASKQNCLYAPSSCDGNPATAQAHSVPPRTQAAEMGPAPKVTALTGILLQTCYVKCMNLTTADSELPCYILFFIFSICKKYNWRISLYFMAILYRFVPKPALPAHSIPFSPHPNPQLKKHGPLLCQMKGCKFLGSGTDPLCSQNYSVERAMQTI